MLPPERRRTPENVIVPQPLYHAKGLLSAWSARHRDRDYGQVAVSNRRKGNQLRVIGNGLVELLECSSHHRVADVSVDHNPGRVGRAVPE